MQSHVLRVGEMTGTFAEIFGAREIASCTGQLRDLGKYTPEFDERLHDGAQPIESRRRRCKNRFRTLGKKRHQQAGGRKSACLKPCAHRHLKPMPAILIFLRIFYPNTLFLLG